MTGLRLDDRVAGGQDRPSTARAQTFQDFDRLLKWLPIGLYTCDRDGNVDRYNERAAEIWGHAPALTGTPIRFCGALRAYRPDGTPLPVDEMPMAELLRTGMPIRDRRVTIERPDGTRRTVLANLDPLQDDEGIVIGGVNCFHDITAQVHAQDALRESDQRLAATYEHAAIGIVECASDGRMLRVNEAMRAICGYEGGELLGRTIFELCPDAGERDGDAEKFRAQVAGELDRYSVEKRVTRKDGRTVWVGVNSSVVRDTSGRFLYAVRVVQDVTERRHANQTLRESERRLRELIEALPAAIYTTDARGTITFYNEAAATLWGHKPELGSSEWCGSWRLYWPDGRPMHHDECPMAVALKENRPIRDAEAVAERPDGTRVPFIPYPTPLRDETGVLVGAVNMLVDISERKESETRQKLLLDELNHRVKNTLATVQSLASQTARRASSPEMFRERLEGRLIALSEAHDQLSRRNWEHADLREIAQSSLAPFWRETGEQIRIDGDALVLKPRAALTFAMIFHELATNAAKYGALSKPDGRLSLVWNTEMNGTGSKLRLQWREIGGPAVTPPERRGFGSLLVERGIGVELGGDARLVFAPSGVTCDIEIPLANGR